MQGIFRWVMATLNGDAWECFRLAWPVLLAVLIVFTAQFMVRHWWRSWRAQR